MSRYSDLGYAGGDGLHPTAGVAIGVGVGTATAVGVRQFTALDKWSEAIGAGAGLAASGALWAAGSKGAAGAAAISTLVNNGLRFALGMLLKKEKFRDNAGAAVSKGAPIPTELGIVRPQQVPTLGAVSAQQVPSLGAVSAERRHLADAGLGLVQADQRQLAAAQLPTFQNAMGAAGQAPVQIVGAQGVGSNYGATIFGSR